MAKKKKEMKNKIKQLVWTPPQLESKSGTSDNYLNFNNNADNINFILMDKIVNFWNYYIVNCGPTVGATNEQEEISRYVHGIQGILAIREFKSNKDNKLLK
jgi:hypothetical protein